MDKGSMLRAFKDKFPLIIFLLLTPLSHSNADIGRGSVLSLTDAGSKSIITTTICSGIFLIKLFKQFFVSSNKSHAEPPCNQIPRPPDASKDKDITTVGDLSIEGKYTSIDVTSLSMENQTKIMYDFALYEDKSFRIFIKTLPHFKTIIQKIHHAVQKKSIIYPAKCFTFLSKINFKRAVSRLAHEAEYMPDNLVSTQLSVQVSSSSHAPIHQSEINYAQLHAQACAQHAAVLKKTGARSEYLLSREDSLSLMAQGDHSIQTKSYMLNAQAQNRFERAGINTCQFAECTGSLIQQDTHAKLINTINMIASASPTNAHTKLIKDGTLDCAQAGIQLNHEGSIKEAIAHADLCTFMVERILHFVDSINPFARAQHAIFDATTAALHAASAHDLAESLNTLRDNMDQFRIGFVSGTIQGVTDIKGIYEGICNTISACGDFLHYIGEQEALADALEFSRFDDARFILTENIQRGTRIIAATEYLSQQASEFIAHMPHMTAEEWRRTGISTGTFVGREAAQFGVIKTSLIGLSKIGQGISTAVQDFETIGKEIALSTQLSGNPVAPSIADIVKQISRIENVLPQNGSRFVSGISATHPEFASHVILDVEKCLIEGAAQAVAEGTSALASQMATVLQLGKQISSSLTEAKPGHIDFSRREQSTTETNSSSSSASSSNQYVAATEEVAGRTGKLSKSEKIAQAELRAKERTYLNEFNEKEKIKCESHHIRTTKGRHELTDIQEGLRDLIPGDRENEILAKPFDYTMQTHVHSNLPESINAAPKPITFNYEHISPEFEIHCSKGIISSKGFHHDYLGKIEKSGFISVIEKEMLPNNCYKYSWRSQGAELKPSTFFPKDWTRAQTIEKIYESMMPVNTKSIIFKGGDKYSHLGLTSEGIPVLSVIKIEGRIAKIITAYPDYITYKAWLEGSI